MHTQFRYIAAFAAAVIFSVLACKGNAEANGYEIYPSPVSWSPDGEYMAAFCAHYWPPRGTMDYGDLWIYDSEGNGAILRTADISCPRFSPDGKYLAAVMFGEVWIWRTFGGTAAMGFQPVGQVTATPAPMGTAQLHPVEDLTWVDAGDGDYFIYYSRGPRFYGGSMYRLQWPALEESVLSKPLDDNSATTMTPALSDDGSRMVYHLHGGAAGSSDYERLWYRPLDGSGAAGRQLTSQQEPGMWGYHESNPQWLDEGNVLFQRGGWGDWNLYSINVDSGEEQLVQRDAQQASLSADGRYMLYTWRNPGVKATNEYDWEIEPSIVLKDRGADEEWMVSGGSSEAQCPAISPDGNTYAWLEPDEFGAVSVRVMGKDEAMEGAVDLGAIEFEAELDADAIDSTAMPLLQEGGPMQMTGETASVVFETTNGDITIECHRDWSPRGYDRFLELVNVGFYDGAPWFRVIEDFVAQCGIAADPDDNMRWGEDVILDDPVVQSNTKGFISFGTAGPDTRSTHIFINFGDNSRLDDVGFSPFAKVTGGMDVALSLKVINDEMFEDAGLMQEDLSMGLDSFRAAFPDADYIQRAYIRDSNGG